MSIPGHELPLHRPPDSITVLGPLALARGTIDRASERRSDARWLDRCWADPGSRVLVVHQGQALVRFRDPDARGSVELVLVPPDEAPEAPGGSRYLLGQDQDRVYFGINTDLPAAHTPEPGTDGTGTDGAGTIRAASLREVGALLGDRDAGLFTHAVALANWHDTHTHCPLCGAPTVPEADGHSARCTSDGSEHFPRTDPAVIMLVTDPGDRCLLARNASWPERRFSILAGFVEPGESAEQAVAREVWEETHIEVDNITYLGSQPWPMPRSLMLGYRAQARSGQEIAVDSNELTEALWFSRAGLLAAIQAGELRIAPSVSIARKIIEHWYGGRLPSGRG